MRKKTETNTNYKEIAQPHSLMEAITNNLRNAIVEGKLHPGQQIKEVDLQEAMNVSRAPVREALLKLEGQGLVEIVPRRGTFVRSMTPRFIQEIFTMRAWLEGLAARLSVKNLTDEDFKKFKTTLKDMARLAKEKNFKDFFFRHWDFHMIFTEKSNNRMLIDQIEVLRRQSLWHSYSITFFEKNYAATLKTHAKMVEIFKSGNEDEAENLIRSHILNAIDDFMKYVDKTY
ncbi:MAG: GntR family transcriptional regulator [Deltaproteobacteria bacterium]|nr:GntR family transcriptional regulator [Deltaproteobacteria bacterium]